MERNGNNPADRSAEEKFRQGSPKKTSLYY